MKPAISVIMAFLLCGVGAEVSGAKVEKTYQGQVLILKKRAPSRFRSNAAFGRFLRAQRIRRDVWPSKKGGKTWRLQFMAFFARPISDVEVKVKFFDVTDGKRLVAADSVFTSARGQRILASSFVLERPEFQIDRKYLMVAIGGRGKGSRAEARFTLRGTPERHSGQVVFSDDEAKAK